MDAVLRKIVKSVGGIRALSRELGVSHQAIGRWKRVPPERVMDVEAATNIPRSVIRPDIYPPEREAGRG
jgi:DNA-binding transcriptional regulator YdaS (Cro superfamily)